MESTRLSEKFMTKSTFFKTITSSIFFTIRRDLDLEAYGGCSLSSSYEELS